MVKNGFYFIKNEFYEIVKDSNLKDNKDQNRPFYYCFCEEDEKRHIYWMIPLSSRILKYKRILEIRKSLNKPLDGIYICELPNNKESVFLIQDMFPITEKYIDREYTLNGNHLILSKNEFVLAIDSKAKTVKSLIEKGIKLTPTSPNIKSILEKLNQ